MEDPWKKNMAIVDSDWLELIQAVLTSKHMYTIGIFFFLVALFLYICYRINSWQLRLIDETKENAIKRRQLEREEEKKRKAVIKRQMRTVKQINFEIAMEKGFNVDDE
jgi:hypothetical protein